MKNLLAPALFGAAFFVVWALTFPGCAAKAPSHDAEAAAAYELTERADSLQTILTLLRTDPGRDIVVRQMMVQAGNDSVLLSLNQYLDRLIVVQDSIRLHTRILRDHYERGYE